MLEISSLVIIAFAFFAGGFVKGVAGMGLPAITVAILVFGFGLPTAMALMILPGLVSNFYQAVAGPQWRVALIRILPFLVPSLFTIWFGTGLLVSFDNSILVTILGVILTVYAGLGLTGFSIQIPSKQEKLIGPVFGLVNGITTGMSGVTSTPSVIYLNGLGLPRETMIQAMGLLFFISYIVLTISLWCRGLVTFEIGSLSAFAVIATLIGMQIGKWLRLRTSEAGFKVVFNWTLLAIGIYLIIRSVFA